MGGGSGSKPRGGQAEVGVDVCGSGIVGQPQGKDTGRHEMADAERRR